MEVETRKARVKSLKRILNNLSIEIKELKTRGFSHTEELDQAQALLNRFCEKLWPYVTDTVQDVHNNRIVHHNRHVHFHQDAART